MSGQIPATNCLPVGALVGAYQITGMLRQGPLATVYSARGPGQASEVAIEVLNDSHPDPARLSRCQREALAAGGVGHPAILAPSAQGLLPDGRAYAILERLEGESLQARLDRRGALPLGEAAPWLDAVMEALGAAHAAGLVHRSLTPATLFLQTGPQGQVHVRVLDFGVSQLIGGDSQLGPQISRDGQVLGSPRYLAPEQASASYGGVGPWTDVYSLGAIAFHVLAGRPPYLAPTAGEILIAHLQAKVPSLREHRQGLPAALDAVLRQALAKRPEERFSTMEAFRRAFRGSLRGSVVLPIGPDLDADQAGPGLGARPAQPSPQRPVSGQDLGLERTLPPGEALAMGDTMTPFAPPSAASPVP
ncbi:MAG: serine/threonine-protein kinase, partial [Polyangia bacterium]|nr:serine/threonine-protein kinase [Polyangia bacterium]